MQVFNKHSLKGKLDFEEFAAQMAMRGFVHNQVVKPQINMQREPPHQIIHEIQQVIKKKGIYGVRAFVNLFKKFGAQKNGVLNHTELHWVLKQNGQTLSNQEMDRLFKFFDKNNDGSITVSEFIEGIRGQLNSHRTKVVKDVFAMMAPEGQIETSKFFSCFDINSVPEFKNGQKTKHAILNELQDQID